MGRPPRNDYPGTIHHVMARGNRGQNIFLNPEDWSEFLNYLYKLKEVYDFDIFSFCLMLNHIHLLIRLGEARLSNIMRRLLGRYARYINHRNRIHGHLFEDRYKSVHCNTQPYLKEVVRYIHLNPVRAGIVDDPYKWPYSSHSVYLGKAQNKHLDLRIPLGQFGNGIQQSRRAYMEFILQGMENPTLVINPFNYSEEKNSEFSVSEDDGFFTPLIRKDRQSLDDLCLKISQSTNYSMKEIIGPTKIREVVTLRKNIIIAALREGYPPSRVAKYMNRSHTTILKIERQAFLSSVH